MSKLITIQDKDRKRIEMLMQALHIRKQIDVIRAALDLLEKEALRIKRTEQWKKATKKVAKESKAINKEFQPHSRLKSL